MAYTSGKDLQSLPTYNGTSTTDASPITKAIVKNIRSRRSFTTGTEFVSSVTDTISNKFPEMTRNAVTLSVYRTLAKFF